MDLAIPGAAAAAPHQRAQLQNLPGELICAIASHVEAVPTNDRCSIRNVFRGFLAFRLACRDLEEHSRVRFISRYIKSIVVRASYGAIQQITKVFERPASCAKVLKITFKDREEHGGWAGLLGAFLEKLSNITAIHFSLSYRSVWAGTHALRALTILEPPVMSSLTLDGGYCSIVALENFLWRCAGCLRSLRLAYIRISADTAADFLAGIRGRLHLNTISIELASRDDRSLDNLFAGVQRSRETKWFRH
ncbi:hypothetical protein Slin14017_G098030 [Septoria linicola]|nr:hypothetical protein Slin14017_G098030 [Septoria linicola]